MRQQLDNVFLLYGDIARCNAKPPALESWMTQEEAETIWADIDAYRYDWVSANGLTRWLQEYAGFNLAAEDQQYLYSVFDVREKDNRISKEEFMGVLSGVEANQAPKMGGMVYNKETNQWE